MVGLVVLILAFGCWVLLGGLLRLTRDEKEPPTIPHGIPYIGHLIGMLRHGSKYYGIIGAKYKLPVYTLRLPWKRIYVVSSPTSLAMVDRNARTVSFAPFVVEFAKRILLNSQHALNELEENIDRRNGAQGCLWETLQVMQAALAPGKALDKLTQDMLYAAPQSIKSVYPLEEQESFDLVSATRRLVTQISTSAIYGKEHNPFQDSKVETGFWAITDDFSYLALDILPRIIASKGHRGRKDFFDGFEKYYEARGHQSASRMVQARYEVNRKHKISDEDIAHFEVSVCVAFLANSTLAAFWALYYVYSQSSLLEEVRSVLSSFIEASRDSVGDSPRHINVAGIVASCPLLGSIIQEALRVQSTNAFGTGRVVLEDTLIEDRYLFKKGSLVMIPTAELHSNASIWGPTAREFDARRFCSKEKIKSKTRVSEFRAFGGGASFCCGSIMAERQIIVVLVTMILRFDLEPTSKESWSLPSSQPHVLGTMLMPTTEFKVKIHERGEYEAEKLIFEWKEI